MPSTTDWRGTTSEWHALLAAVTRNCECGGEWGLCMYPCSAHTLITDGDQHALDRLLFARRIAPRLVAEEFRPSRELAS
jgi:hypothetical protein